MVRMRLVPLLIVLSLGLSACGDTRQEPQQSPDSGAASGEITVYSGRSEELVGPLLDRFEQETGIKVNVSYKDTAELAAQLLEEGDRSPADVFFAQDAGALGAVAAEDRFTELDESLLQRVPEKFRASDGRWVGVSGRARVAVYNTEKVTEQALPENVDALTEETWRDRVGWAPTNGSFQAFVTAMRLTEGEEETRRWLVRMKENGTKVYEKNSAIVKAVAAGEIDIGLVNHYYLLQLSTEDPSLRERAANHFFQGGPGALVNVAGVGILGSGDNPGAASRFVEFLLSEQGQQYFADETFEYPLASGVPADEILPPLDELDPPDIDLSNLDDLVGTLELLRQTGVLDA